jgi:hypothetical protein
METNYCLFKLLHDNGTKAVQYCVAKETQQCCTSALLCNRAPTSRSYGNHNTQHYYIYTFFLLHICLYLLHWYFISFFLAVCGYNITCLKNKCHTLAHRELKKTGQVQVFRPNRSTRPSTRPQSKNCS